MATQSTIKYVSLFAVAGSVLAMPTFPQMNVVGLIVATVSILMIMMLQTSDYSPVNYMNILPNAVVAGMLILYTVLSRQNREYIESSSMPDQWGTYAWFISITLMVHLVLIYVGGTAGCLKWFTMAVIVIFIGMQRIVADHFRTDGFTSG